MRTEQHQINGSPGRSNHRGAPLHVLCEREDLGCLGSGQILYDLVDFLGDSHESLLAT
jgi:hypothetical protein